MRAVTKQLRLASRGFCYKVALYLSYLHIKFDDEIRRESLWILRIISDYRVSKVKLTSMLQCNYSQSLLLDTSVICLSLPLRTDGKGTNNILWEASDIFMQSLYQVNQKKKSHNYELAIHAEVDDL